MEELKINWESGANIKVDINPNTGLKAVRVQICIADPGGQMTVNRWYLTPDQADEVSRHLAQLAMALRALEPRNPKTEGGP